MGAQQATWDGRIHGRPAPAGTYLVGLDVTDAACNTGHFPATLPPAPGSTPDAGVTVRYLAAEPPLDPVPAGLASGRVRRRAPPAVQLVAASGSARRKPVAHGHASAYALRVPRARDPGAGLYVLALRSGAALDGGPAGRARRRGAASEILVVLPGAHLAGAQPGRRRRRRDAQHALAAGCRSSSHARSPTASRPGSATKRRCSPTSTAPTTPTT